jgi:hypothetical protein
MRQFLRLRILFPLLTLTAGASQRAAARRYDRVQKGVCGDRGRAERRRKVELYDVTRSELSYRCRLLGLLEVNFNNFARRLFTQKDVCLKGEAT